MSSPVPSRFPIRIGHIHPIFDTLVHFEQALNMSARDQNIQMNGTQACGRDTIVHREGGTLYVAPSIRDTENEPEVSHRKHNAVDSRHVQPVCDYKRAKHVEMAFARAKAHRREAKQPQELEVLKLRIMIYLIVGFIAEQWAVRYPGIDISSMELSDFL
ncbi:hypothetical protein BDW22DRAFT_1428097 [Trametopsis cervina]|nr:hypothetical protein BDW22DRAFT_1428097 [Trametopsis cervina]